MTWHDKKRRLWDTFFGSSSEPVDPWSVIAADTFAAADNTPLVGRVTSQGGIVYTDKENANPDIRIRGNRATFEAFSYGNTVRLLLGTDHVEGLRVSMDYEFYGIAPQVGSLAVLAGTDWSPHSGGITLDQNGGLSTTGSVPTTNLVGTTSGLPKVGRLTVQWLPAGVSILIDGAEVATAQMTSPLKGQLVDIGFNSNAAAIDNLTIEAYNAVPPPAPVEDPNPGDAVYSKYSTSMPVDHVGIVRVGAARDHKTITGAIEVAQDVAEGRVLIIVDAGTYNEQISVPPRVDLAGVTGNPEDVVIEHTCPTGFSPINTTGGPIWIGGLTSRLLTFPERVGTGVYSIHHHGSGMTIFESVDLDSEDGIGSIGMDGDANSATWLIGCKWFNHVADNGLASNMHGTGTNAAPLRLAYVGCDTSGLGINYSGLGSGQADEVYVQGGSVARVNVQGIGTVARIDPTIVDVAVGDGVTLYRNTYLPDRPVRGV